MGLLFAVLLALSVKQDQAPLRAGCDLDSSVVTALPAGTPLELRYMMASDHGPCYKVKATLGTRVVEGYLPPEAMDGLNTFERGRRRAESVSLSSLMEAARPPAQTTPNGPVQVWFGGGVPRALVTNAEAAMAANEPRKALELLEPYINQARPDAGLLAMAGYAAWKADDGLRALALWQQSMAIRPNPTMKGLYAQVERELAGDQSHERLEGANVLLRFADGVIAPETAQQMLATVDATYLKISQELGCKVQEKIVIIVQNRESYVASTNAAAWNGGLYDGRIRLPMYDQYMGEEEERVVAHETTHACLALLGRWPTWFQEGMAQRLSGEKLSPFAAAKLTGLAREKKLPSLASLGNDWSRLSTEQAGFAYALAAHAVNRFYDYYGHDGVVNLIRNPQQLPAISLALDKILAGN